MLSIKLTSKGKWNVLNNGATVGTIERVERSAPVMNGRIQVASTRHTAFVLTCGTRSETRYGARTGKEALEDFQTIFGQGLAPRVSPGSLDSLAKVASGLGLSPNELAAELAVAPATVQAWIDGAARPAEETRAELATRVAHRLAAFQKGNAAQHRIAALVALAVALQTPTERKLWLAKRAEIRALYAR